MHKHVTTAGYGTILDSYNGSLPGSGMYYQSTVLSAITLSDTERSFQLPDNSLGQISATYSICCLGNDRQGKRTVFY